MIGLPTAVTPTTIYGRMWTPPSDASRFRSGRSWHVWPSAVVCVRRWSRSTSGWCVKGSISDSNWPKSRYTMICSPTSSRGGGRLRPEASSSMIDGKSSHGIADGTSVPGLPTKGPFRAVAAHFAALSVGSGCSLPRKPMGIANQAISSQSQCSDWLSPGKSHIRDVDSCLYGGREETHEANGIGSHGV